MFRKNDWWILSAPCDVNQCSSDFECWKRTHLSLRMNEVREDSQLDRPVLSCNSVRGRTERKVLECSHTRLTDLPLEDTGNERLGELDQAENDKVRQEKLDVFLVHSRVAPVECLESEHSGGDESETLGDGQGQSEEVERDKQDVAIRGDQSSRWPGQLDRTGLTQRHHRRQGRHGRHRTSSRGPSRLESCRGTLGTGSLACQRRPWRS